MLALMYVFVSVNNVFNTEQVIKYWKNLRTQQSVFCARFYCALLTLHVSAPFRDHFQVVHKHKNIQGSHYIFKGSVE
jgi:hypothetical protein